MSIISDYVSKLNLKDIDPLSFLIEDSINSNPYHKYIVRKIVSQLQVENHIHLLGPALKTDNEESIFRQIIDNDNPILMRRLIEKSNSEKALNRCDISPYLQILSTDYDKLTELKLKKRTIFDRIRAKFVKDDLFDETQIYGSKKEKIIKCYYTIPAEIAKKKKELADLRWTNIKEKIRLKREIKNLNAKKEQYHSSILKWYFSPNDVEKSEHFQEDWQQYYLSHEKEMLEWIDYKKDKLSPDISEEDKTAFLESYCDEYFRATDLFGHSVEMLKQDVVNNLSLIKTVFGKNYKDMELSDILKELRSSMDNKLMPKGMTKYRTYDIPTSSSNAFFSMSSKAEDIKGDMQNLEIEYSELKSIENKDEYLTKAIDIFQRFIQIHPYSDGNGRTSRALLDIMLINRDIIPPILYDTYYQRGNLDRLSMEYLSNQNKEPLQNYIKRQVEKVQPNTEDPKEKIQSTYLSQRNEDINQK